MEGQLLKYNPNPKILGVTLDEKMKFKIHIESVERKAVRSLELLRKIKEREVLQLYKALVVTQLAYVALVWQIGNCTGLDIVQGKGLAMCLGVPGRGALRHCR